MSKYKQEFIGKGGFSQVYRISDLVVEKRLYNKDPKSKKRFIQEIDLISKLRHKNIVSIKDIDRQNFKYTMPYFKYDYKKYLNSIKQNGIFPIDIIHEICNGIKFIHENSIIHRDIKPQNVLIDETGENVVISDFGLSKELLSKSDLTSEGIGGEAYFIAPELSSGKITDDIRSDIFSLGRLIQYTFEELEINPDEDLKFIINKATNLDYKQRYNSVEELKKLIIENSFLKENQVNNDIFLAIDFVNNSGNMSLDLFWSTIMLKISEAEDAYFEKAFRKILSSSIIIKQFCEEEVLPTFEEYVSLYCEMLKDREDIHLDSEEQNLLISELFELVTEYNVSEKIKIEIWTTLIYIACQAKLKKGSYYVLNTIKASYNNLENDMKIKISSTMNSELSVIYS
ncbi:serine/threonine-protein kinase [Streptococcus suis]|uniref:serine/threonine-protein kinase n=1 Tax=Streptococcus suis TaxID=1307 RepID=UPI0034620F8E